MESEETALDGVLEQDLGAVVGEAFAESHEADGIDTPGDLVGHTAKVGQFLFRRIHICVFVVSRSISGATANWE